MAVRMTKPWRALEEASVRQLPGQLGVYQIADREGELLYIGFAGGRSLYGLRGELLAELEARDPKCTQGLQYRIEVNTSYQTRYRELLMAYQHDTGDLPVGNRDNPPPNLGRISPA